MKIGPVVSAENILVEIALRFNVVFRRFLSNISGFTGLIFAVFSPYIRADDGSVHNFPMCQGTLPWQPNNVAVMKANWYYVYSLHVRQVRSTCTVQTFWFLLLARGRHWRWSGYTLGFATHFLVLKCSSMVVGWPKTISASGPTQVRLRYL